MERPSRYETRGGVALTEMLPLGPWPGLLVIHTSDQIEWDRTELLRVPGPVDERVLAVIRHEQHFDPVWWETGNKYKAVCPCLPSSIERISATLTADFGSARGALRILGAAYCRSLPFLPLDSVQCTGSHAEEALTEIGNWEPWIQYIEHAGILSDVDKTRTAIVFFGCRHPCPPYPEVWSVTQGLMMLVPTWRIAQGSPADLTSTLIIIAFDTGGCHLGTATKPEVRNALTGSHRAAQNHDLPLGGRWGGSWISTI